VESVGGQRFLFAILVNDYPGKHAQVTAAIDDLGVTIASSGSALGPSGAARQMVAGAIPLSSPADELRARVLTYTSLGKLHDKHNLPFLRTALRTERDPALKAVVAEALFQCDPQDGAGGRAVLDAWSATPEVFGRLIHVAHELNIPVPVVGALLDVAAEGSAEALARTVELAPLVQAEPALKTTLADGLEQISRNAPDELLVVLRSSPADASRAALELLVQGVAASTEPLESPFPRALETAERSKDAELAAFAKATQATYESALAQAKAAPKVAPATAPAPTPGAVAQPAKAEGKPQVIPAAANPALPAPSPGAGGH
jgi:D-alanyl-D-alanine carboxypeptidase/D-alanyl-D-alanine-endopeptidase (penicillin-binding protein 4)